MHERDIRINIVVVVERSMKYANKSLIETQLKLFEVVEDIIRERELLVYEECMKQLEMEILKENEKTGDVACTDRMW